MIETFGRTGKAAFDPEAGGLDDAVEGLDRGALGAGLVGREGGVRRVGRRGELTEGQARLESGASQQPCSIHTRNGINLDTRCQQFEELCPGGTGRQVAGAPDEGCQRLGDACSGEHLRGRREQVGDVDRAAQQLGVVACSVGHGLSDDPRLVVGDVRPTGGLRVDLGQSMPIERQGRVEERLMWRFARGSLNATMRSCFAATNGFAAPSGSTPMPSPASIILHKAAKLWTWMRARNGLRATAAWSINSLVIAVALSRATKS